MAKAMLRFSPHIVALMLSLLAARATHAATPPLSPAQSAVIAAEIGKIKISEGRSITDTWSSAKKVAEFICQPLAKATLRWQENADRVFLGTSDTAGLALEGNTTLTGHGSYRARNSWVNIQFTCRLDPETGRATAFTWGPEKKR